PPPETPGAPLREFLALLTEAERRVMQVVRRVGDWLRVLVFSPPFEGLRPAPVRPGTDERPISPEESESLKQLPEEASLEAEAPADGSMSAVGLRLCVLGLSPHGPVSRRRSLWVRRS